MNRGTRNNNPLNIRRSKDRWQGVRVEQKDSAFVQFETMAYGYRAVWKALESYWKHFHTTQRERHEKLHPHRAPALRLGWQGEPAAAIARGGGSLVADCF